MYYSIHFVRNAFLIGAPDHSTFFTFVQRYMTLPDPLTSPFTRVPLKLSNPNSQLDTD